MEKALIKLQTVILRTQETGKLVREMSERIGTFSAEDEKTFDKEFPPVYDIETLR